MCLKKGKHATPATRQGWHGETSVVLPGRQSYEHRRGVLVMRTMACGHEGLTSSARTCGGRTMTWTCRCGIGWAGS